MVPITLLNDLRVSADAVRAYGVLLDVERDRLAKISLRRIADRLGCHKNTAYRIMQRLKDAGWVEITEDRSGRCQVYRLLTVTTDGDGSSAKSVTSYSDGAESTVTPRGDGSKPTVTICDAQPSPFGAQSVTTSGDLSIRYLNYSLEDDEKIKSDDGERGRQLPHRLGDLYANVVKNGSEGSGKQDVNLDAELTSPSEAVA